MCMKHELLDIFDRHGHILSQVMKMRYAVIAPDEEYQKKYIWQRRKPSIKWLSYENGEGCDVVLLPYRSKELEDIGTYKLRRLIKSIRSILGEDNEYVFFPADKRLRGAMEEEGFREPEGSDVFLDVTDVVVRKCVKNHGWKIEDVEVGVYDYELTNKGIELIRVLSEHYGHISLFTQEVEAAGGYMEEIYEESGMPVRVSDDFSGYLPRMQVVVALGEIVEGQLTSDSIVLDIFGENTDKKVRTISKVKFSFLEEDGTLERLTGRMVDQAMLDFMILTGARLVIPKNVQVTGYCERA